MDQESLRNVPSASDHPTKRQLSMKVTTLVVLFLVFPPILFATVKCIARLISIISSQMKRVPPLVRSRGSPTHLLIVLGSGGHTAEMLAMLSSINPRNIAFRTYVVSSGDDFSAKKAREFEQHLAERWATRSGNKPCYIGEAHFAIHTVPRARRIYQPLYTTPWTCARCFVGCIRALRAVPLVGFEQQRGSVRRPDLIVMNGPATAVVVACAAITLKYFGLVKRHEMRTIYVESFARVKKLSLSGRILLYVVDRFFVQWEVLKKRVGNRAEFIGVLV